MNRANFPVTFNSIFMVQAVNQRCDRILFWATAATTAGFFLIVTLAVVFRYVLKQPLMGSIEMSRLCFVWACFLAAALTYRRQAHIAISFVVERFSPGFQRLLRRLVALAGIIFLGLLGYASLEVIGALWPARLPVLGISQAWFYVPIPLVSVIMLSYTLETLMIDPESIPGPEA